MDVNARTPQGTPKPDENVDLFDYALIRDYVGFVLRAPRRHKVLAGGALVLVALVSLISMKVLPFRYQVQAKILAQRNQLMSALSNPMNREWDAPTRAAREVVIRRDNLVALCKQTNFIERYLEKRSPAARARDWLIRILTGKQRDRDNLLEDLVDTLEARLWVVVDQEGVVTITFEWSDREIAYQIVEAAVQSFLEARHASEISVVGETIAILQGHDAKLQPEIAAAISQVEEKERALRIRTGPRQVPIVRPRVPQDEELARIEGVYTARRRALTDLEEFRQRRLAEMQGQLAQQLTIYAPQHPAVLSTRQAIESLSGSSPQIDALRTETQDLGRELARRGGRPSQPATAASGIQYDLTEARLRLESGDPRLDYERDKLRLLLRQHQNLQERIDSARVEMDTAQAGFKYRYSVITPPQLPKKPIKPYGLLIMVSGMVGGVALAFFASTVADLRAGRIVERWQVERSLDLPVLAEFRS